MTKEDYRPEVLRALREGLGLTTVEMAKLLQTTDRTIQRAEDDSLSYKLLKRYCAVFALDRERILKPLPVKPSKMLAHLRRRAREVMARIEG